MLRMNGSAQKARRWTKGGSLSRSTENTLSHLSRNHGNGASSPVAPVLRNVIAELFSWQGCDRSQSSPPREKPDSLQVGSADLDSSAHVQNESSSEVTIEGGSAEESVAQFPRWKRCLDLIVVLGSLPLWLPIMILVMILIKIGSPGPIFYRQERVGYRRKLFMIFKFRSMKVNAETSSHERHFATLIGDNSPMTKLDTTGDPRLIPLGRVLRATGLDELPQLFNVLRGEMSLVGPRPCLPYEFQRYEPWQQERINAAPGLTGYWQVNGKNKTTFGEMIDMDIFYSKNMSLWLDLTIMLKTFPAIVQQVREAQIRARSQAIVASSVRPGPSTLTT
jgi:lipopolysaccharide/colanic/teichoic acid biosynthesis glycosyltransferase